MLVADDAFPLRENIQKPYAQKGLTREKRLYNYRLSRARRIVENAFRILANRFRVFMTPIGLSPERVEVLIMACCCLHNFLRTQSGAKAIYMPSESVDSENPETHEVVPGTWRQSELSQGLAPPSKEKGHRQRTMAKDYRDHLRDYFISSEGAVPWQDSMI